MKNFGNGFTLVDKSIYRYDSETFTNLKKVIDYSTFILVKAYEDKTFYFKDDNHVYVTSYMCTPSVIENAEPATFTVINAEEGISHDGSNYYWYNKILPYDYSTAIKYNEYYVRANNDVFFITEPVEGADANTFTIIWQNIGKDNNHLFFKGKKDTDVDVTTFKMVPGCFDSFHLDQSHTYYAADKKNVYFINTLGKSLKKLGRVKPNEFTVKIDNERLYGIAGKDTFYFGIRKKGM